MNEKRLAMQQAVLTYSKWSKKDKKNRWPRALLEVEKLRKNINRFTRRENNLRDFVNSKITSEYHVHKTY